MVKDIFDTKYNVLRIKGGVVMVNSATRGGYSIELNLDSDQDVEVEVLVHGDKVYTDPLSEELFTQT